MEGELEEQYARVGFGLCSMENVFLALETANVLPDGIRCIAEESKLCRK